MKTEIFGHWPDETWHEVLRLVAGRLAPRFVKEILDWLLQQQDPDQSCNHIFLAARCVGEVRNRGELGSIEASVMQCTRDLTKLGLGSSSTPMTRPEEVTQVKAVLEQAVALVAEVWKDNKETLPWLKELAQSHQNEDVRSNAVKLLSFGWKDDPDTQMICKEIAQSDVSWKVRVYAMTLLRLQEDNGATLKILKECAQSDEAWIVRLCAVGLLSEFVKGNPDILAILKERAQFDEDDKVRKFSVQRLAHVSKDEPEVLAFLESL
jgi:predicted NACHT family NTPase